MKTLPTDIDGVTVILPDVHRDGRGYFVETYNAARYRALGIVADFVQDNESQSQRGVFRGLHWQAGEHAQAKLIRVVRGAVLDIAVDIRRGSPTFGRHVAVELSDENGRQLFIPRGFAHGFLVLRDDTVFSYKCDNTYAPESERGLRFDDPALGLALPDLGVPPILSDKDRRHPTLAEITPFDPVGVPC